MTTPVNVLAVADEARFNRFHFLVFLWCFVIVIADGFDLALAGIALPAIMKSMNLDAARAGVMVSSAFFGMMCGSITLGILADRIGRRKALALCVLLFSVFTAAAGLTHEPYSFAAMRFLGGLGIGGALPCVAAQMTEYAPKRVRGLLFTAMTCGVAVGSTVAALVGKALLEAHGWPALFFTAVVPLVLIPFIFTSMPESMPFLLARGDHAQLRRTVARLVPGRAWGDDVQFEVPPAHQSGGATVRELFARGRGASTLVFWLMFFLNLFMTYALSSWLVKLLAMAGHSLGSALNFLLIFNAGAIAGGLGGGWLADRLNIKWVLCVLFAVSAVVLTLLGYGVQPLWLVVGLVGATTLGAQIVSYAYLGQFYPTAIRSTAVGFASGIGRMGAICAPIVIGLLVSLNLPLVDNFIAIALAGLVNAVAVMLIDQRHSATVHGAQGAGRVVGQTSSH